MKKVTITIDDDLYQLCEEFGQFDNGKSVQQVVHDVLQTYASEKITPISPSAIDIEEMD